VTEFPDASLIPLEKALLARAEALENRESPGHIGPDGALANHWLAAEFRALAEELHNQ